MLGISQPSLTRRIRRLEKEVGTYLFERYPNGIRLTAAGELFRARAAQIAQDLENLTADLARTKAGDRGRLTISFFASLSAEVCLQVLREFRQLDKLDLELCEATPLQQIRSVRQFRSDLALTVGPVDDTDLNSEFLWTEQLVVALPSDHALKAKERLTWSDLVAERMLVSDIDHDHWIAGYVSRLAESQGYLLDIVEFAATRENMIGLVRAGFGITLFPESSLWSLNTEGLLTRPMIGPATEMQIVGVWLPENANPALRRFLETVTLAVRESQDQSQRE